MKMLNSNKGRNYNLFKQIMHTVRTTSSQHLVGDDVQSALIQCFSYALYPCTLEVKIF